MARAGNRLGFLMKALPHGALARGIDQSGKRRPGENGARLRRGCLPGTADTYVLWNNVTVWLEEKASAGGLGTGQDAFRDAVLANGGHWALVRSTEDIATSAPSHWHPAPRDSGRDRERIADQRERLPAKGKSATRTTATPRHVASASLSRSPAAKGILDMSRPNASAALATSAAGARTYRDIQRVLGIRRVHARVVVYNLAVAGLMKRRGYLRAGRTAGEKGECV